MTTKRRLFESLGFSEKQLRIYELVIDQGPATVGSLAKELKLPRATVYWELSRLQESGLISISGSQKKQRFLAENPKKITELINERVKTLTNLVPLVNEFIAQTEEKVLEQHRGLPHIAFFRGVEGIKRVHETLLTAKPKYYMPSFPLQRWYRHTETTMRFSLSNDDSSSESE